MWLVLGYKSFEKPCETLVYPFVFGVVNSGLPFSENTLEERERQLK